jgi:hypothetical protein
VAAKLVILSEFLPTRSPGVIRVKTLNSYLSATGLGYVAGLAGYSCWRLGFMPDLTAFFPVTPATSLTNLDFALAGAGLVGYSVALSLTINRLGLRRSWSYIAASVLLAAIIYLIGSELFGVDLLLVPVIFTGSLALLLVQVNRLWSVDRQFARTLLNSPVSAGETRIAANARLMSGLKLLNTVLPLNEAVVFHYDESDSLEAVARLKGLAPNTQDPRRNYVWREGIELCQKAAAKGELVLQTADGPNSSAVAVPLLHERETAGVLLVRLASEFSADDAPLLEAVGSQFARNLKRESFSNNPARTQHFSYFSQTGNKRKLDALNVLKALTVEQKCEAGTLAHIDDGVAIAYLDGTIALVNPALLKFAGLT